MQSIKWSLCLILSIFLWGATLSTWSRGDWRMAWAWVSMLKSPMGPMSSPLATSSFEISRTMIWYVVRTTSVLHNFDASRCRSAPWYVMTLSVERLVRRWISLSHWPITPFEQQIQTSSESKDVMLPVKKYRTFFKYPNLLFHLF